MKTLNSKKSGVKTSDIDSSGALDIDGAGNVTIDSTTGSITLGATLTDGQTLKLGKNAATEMIFTPHGTAGSEKISLTNTAGDAADAIKLLSTAGGVTIDAGNGTVTFADNGASLGTITSSGYSGAAGSAATATLATTVTVTDSNANTDFPVVFHDESNALLDDTAAFEYNPSTGALTLNKLILTAQDALSADTTNDRVLVWDANGSDAIKFETFANVCFLKGTKITLLDNSQKPIEDLTLEDEVLTYNIEELSEIRNKNLVSKWHTDDMKGTFSKSGIRNIWINPTDSYLVINDKLRVTKHHLIHYKRDNRYYFNFSENLNLGDELLTDKGSYERIETLEEIRENINVYNFELDKDQTYFAENYLVHHYCKLCSGYANII